MEKENNLVNNEVEQEVVTTNNDVEEMKVEETSTKYMKPIYIESEESLCEGIEKRQTLFNEELNNNKKTSTIILVVFIVLMVLVVFGLGAMGGDYTPFIIGLIVVYFIILFVFSNNSKKKLTMDADKLIDDYFLELDSYVTQNEAFEDVTFNSHDKMGEEKARAIKIIKDINHIGGRDVIKGKVCGDEFEAGDLLIKTVETNEEGKTQNFIVFLGKMFFIEKKNTVKDGRAILYLKGKGANGPTDVEGLELVEGKLSEKFMLYSSCDLSDVLNSEVIEILEQFEVNELLIDMFITFDEERLSFGFSYSDAVMRVPLVESLDRASITQYKQDVERMVAILKAIK